MAEQKDPAEPELVVWNGAQWHVDRLPAGVDKADCVPIDEWFAQERTTGSDEPSKPAPKSKRAKSADEG